MTNLSNVRHVLYLTHLICNLCRTRFASLLLLTVLSAPCRGDETGDRILAKHVSSRQQIANFSCRTTSYKSDRAPPDKTDVVWECISHRSNDRLRTIGSEGNDKFDKIISGGILVSYAPAKNTYVKTSRVNPFLSRYDPFVEALIAINIPNKLDYVVLEDFMKLATSWKCETTGTDRDALFTVHYKADTTSSTVRITLAANVNYLIQSIEYDIVTPRGKTWRKHSIGKFKDIQNGIYFPLESTTHIRMNDVENGKYRTEFTDFDLQRIPDSKFVHAYRPGSTMGDSVDGTVYKVDSTGKASGPVKPLGRQRPPAMSVEAGTENSETGYPEEPGQNRNPWTIAIAIGLLAAVLCFAFIKIRSRRHRNNDSK